MKGHRLVITFVAVALVAALIGAGAAATRGTPDWLDALNARSAALNERYGLGDDAARRTLEVPAPEWLQALMARSDAMNRENGLGKYARQTTRTSSAPDWLAALNARSEALNRQYGLGGYAPKR
ncbi:MAG TPA: hypothetical protein VL264_05075 [Gaiella sp.]|jgi:hypothetical protein|nr:hypothetical protein [Gaiella sp.]